MTHPDSPIAIALRDLAGQAAPPRLNIDTAWHTGRRRRWTAVATSVAGAAGAVAAAILVPLALLSSPAHPAPGPPPLGPAGTHRPYPVEFRQVARITDKPCPAHSHGLPGTIRPACFYFTQSGMRAEPVTYIRLNKPVSHGVGYDLTFRVLPHDRHRFAVLTRGLVGLPSPHNELAIVIGRVVVASPVVEGELSSGYFQITVPSLGQAHEILHRLGIR
jgi:hypothetical protein